MNGAVSIALHSGGSCAWIGGVGHASVTVPETASFTERVDAAAIADACAMIPGRSEREPWSRQS